MKLSGFTVEEHQARELQKARTQLLAREAEIAMLRRQVRLLTGALRDVERASPAVRAALAEVAG